MNRFRGHKLLSDTDADDHDRIIAGKSYTVRYLGVESLPSDATTVGCTDDAVSEIYRRYSDKTKFKCLTTKELFISANCVSLSGAREEGVLFRYSTVNITFCNTDNQYPNAFVFVGRDGSGALNAHVLHCDSPAKANDICTSMSQAFAVRTHIHHAKRIEKAGWESSCNGEVNNNTISLDCKREGFPEKLPTGDIDGNQFGDVGLRTKTVPAENLPTPSISNNNNSTLFGGFASLKHGSPQGSPPGFDNGTESEKSAAASPQPIKINLSSSLPTPVMRNLMGNKHKPLSKIVLGLQMNRMRSNSLPQVENQATAAKKEQTWTNARPTSPDEDDPFSTLARERSHSLSLVRPVS